MGNEFAFFIEYCVTPERLLRELKIEDREISIIEKKLKNPINVKTGKPLKPKTIKKYKSNLKSARRSVKVKSEIIEQVYHHNLQAKPFLEYPLRPCKAIHYKMSDRFARNIEPLLEYPLRPYIANRAWGGNEKVIHYKILDNFIRFIELIKSQDEYFHDDLCQMVKFVLGFQHPKITGRLVSYVVYHYIELLQEIMQQMEDREHPKVVNLQEWRQA